MRLNSSTVTPVPTATRLSVISCCGHGCRCACPRGTCRAHLLHCCLPLRRRVPANEPAGRRQRLPLPHATRLHSRFSPFKPCGCCTYGCCWFTLRRAVRRAPHTTLPFVPQNAPRRAAAPRCRTAAAPSCGKRWDAITRAGRLALALLHTRCRLRCVDDHCLCSFITSLLPCCGGQSCRSAGCCELPSARLYIHSISHTATWFCGAFWYSDRRLYRSPAVFFLPNPGFMLLVTLLRGTAVLLGQAGVHVSLYGSKRTLTRQLKTAKHYSACSSHSFSSVCWTTWALHYLATALSYVRLVEPQVLVCSVHRVAVGPGSDNKTVPRDLRYLPSTLECIAKQPPLFHVRYSCSLVAADRLVYACCILCSSKRGRRRGRKSEEFMRLLRALCHWNAALCWKGVQSGWVPIFYKVPIPATFSIPCGTEGQTLHEQLFCLPSLFSAFCWLSF